MDSEEKQALKDLHKNFEQQWAVKQKEAEQGLEIELNKARQNSVTPLSDENIQHLTNNYWQLKQPELDATRQNLGNEMFKDWGGSEKAVLERLNADGQQQIQEAKELQENQQLDMQHEHDRQNEIASEHQRDKDAKEKKEKDQEAQEKTKQQNLAQAEKQEKALERDRLREQFNHQRGGQDRGR